MNARRQTSYKIGSTRQSQNLSAMPSEMHFVALLLLKWTHAIFQIHLFCLILAFRFLSWTFLRDHQNPECGRPMLSSNIFLFHGSDVIGHFPLFVCRPKKTPLQRLRTRSRRKSRSQWRWRRKLKLRLNPKKRKRVEPTAQPLHPPLSHEGKVSLMPTNVQNLS